jgi:hypothetical protein
MGTQQILLIVLSVIIVGVAVAVGITMFGSQAYNSNRQAVSAELTNYASQVLQFWKTPLSLGGAGNRTANLTIARVTTYVGFDPANNNGITTGNGEFRVTDVSGTVVTLKGLGNEQKAGNKPLITTKVNVAIDSIGTIIGVGTGF